MMSLFPKKRLDTQQPDSLSQQQYITWGRTLISFIQWSDFLLKWKHGGLFLKTSNDHVLQSTPDASRRTC